MYDIGPLTLIFTIGKHAYNIPDPLLQQNNAAPAAIPIIPAQFDFDFDFPVDFVDRDAVFVLCILCFISLLALSHVLQIF